MQTILSVYNLCVFTSVCMYSIEYCWKDTELIALSTTGIEFGQVRRGNFFNKCSFMTFLKGTFSKKKSYF